MTAPITISIVGTPAPGGSKKAFRHRHSGKVIVMDDAKNNGSWKSLVAFTASQQYQGAPLTGPLVVDAVFRIARPASHFNAKGLLKASAPSHPAKRPDATKLWRSTEDALTGILWADDSQIVDQRQRKEFAAARPAGVEITVRGMA